MHDTWTRTEYHLPDVDYSNKQASSSLERLQLSLNNLEKE